MLGTKTSWIAILVAGLGLSACGGGSDTPGMGFPADGGTAANPDGATPAPMGGDGGGTPTDPNGGNTPDPSDAGANVPMGDSGSELPSPDPDAGVMEGGVSPDGGMAPPPPEAGTASEDLGMGDGQDVITIGDSYMNLNDSEGLQYSLEEISGRDYRNYAQPGTRVLDEAIPDQYVTARDEDPDIKTVVATAGGNDVLQGQLAACQAFNDACRQTIDDVAARLTELMNTMADDGVKDVVLIGYGYTTGFFGGLDQALDYAREKMTDECTEDRTPSCHYIDPADELMGMIRADGIHPTAAGYDLLGEMTWERMKQEGVRR